MKPKLWTRSRRKGDPMRKQKNTWAKWREQNAAAWRALLRSDDVEALIQQAHKDAAYFRRTRKFPREDREQ